MKLLRIVVISAVSLTLSACFQYIGDAYLTRKDTAELASGEAVAWNSAIQVRDPWPRHAFDPKIAFDGARMSRTVQLYREGTPQRTEAQSGARGTEPSAPAEAGGTPAGGGGAPAGGGGAPAGGGGAPAAGAGGAPTGQPY
jgi:hypothetical protein